MELQNLTNSVTVIVASLPRWQSDVARRTVNRSNLDTEDAVKKNWGETEKACQKAPCGLSNGSPRLRDR